MLGVLELDAEFFLRDGVGAVQVGLKILAGEGLPDEGDLEGLVFENGSLHGLHQIELRLVGLDLHEGTETL